MRTLKAPAIYKHFKNKFYATMGEITLVDDEKFQEIFEKPNVIFFYCNETETKRKYLVIRNKKKFFIKEDEYLAGKEFVLYKSLYDGANAYIREKEMFLSKVDMDKHPNTDQQYRFEEYTYSTI